MSAWPWRTLGIAPTGDRKEIRSAYARKLKSGNYDAADAFAKLRGARDAALRLAEGAVAAAPVEDHSDGGNPGARDVSLSPPVLAHDGVGISAGVVSVGDEAMPLLSEGLAADRGAGVVIATEGATFAAPLITGHATVAPVGRDALLSAYQEACRRVYQALHDEPSDMLLSAAEAADVRRDLDVAIGLAREESVEQQADFETWLAEVIVQTLPRSEPALDIAARVFGWAERGKMVDAPLVIAGLGERMAAMAFVGQVESAKHRWHRAYRELRKPAGERSRRGRFVGSRKIRDLLTHVRTHHPIVERNFDSWRVELWEQAARQKQGIGTFFLIIVVVINIVRVVTGNFGGSDKPNPVPVDIATPLPSTPEEAMAPTLNVVGGNDLTVDAVKQRNPALYADLLDVWKDVYARNGDLPDFTSRARTLIVDRGDLAMGTAGYAISRERVSATRKMAGRFYAEHPRYCVDFLDGKTMTDEWLRDYRESYRHVLVNALLERSTPASLPARRERFDIPGEVMKDIARRAHLSDSAVRKALNGSGADEDKRCKVRLALMDAALAAPLKIGLPLLRSL